MTSNILFMLSLLTLTAIQIEAVNAMGLPALENAAAKGDAHAMNALGESLSNGTHGKSDQQRACALFEKAALKGHAKAMRNRGNCSLKGMTGPRNVKDAFFWFNKAIAAGDRRTYCIKGRVYVQGWLVKQNIEKGLALCRKALYSNLKGMELEYVNLLTSKKISNRRETLNEAERWLRKAVARGEIAAKTRLAQILKTRSFEKPAKDEYLALTRELADQGIVWAYMEMAKTEAAKGFDWDNKQVTDEAAAEQACFWYSMGVLSQNRSVMPTAMIFGKPVCEALPEAVRSRALAKADRTTAAHNKKH